MGLAWAMTGLASLPLRTLALAGRCLPVGSVIVACPLRLMACLARICANVQGGIGRLLHRMEVLSGPVRADRRADADHDQASCDSRDGGTRTQELHRTSP
jgi:hypothetical protein